MEKADGTKLRDMSIDLVLVCNVLFQVEDKSVVVAEVKRILKPQGKVLVVDWSDSFAGLGPHPDVVVAQETVMDLFEHAGFHLDREVSAGEHHYGLLYKKL